MDTVTDNHTPAPAAHAKKKKLELPSHVIKDIKRYRTLVLIDAEEKLKYKGGFKDPRFPAGLYKFLGSIYPELKIKMNTKVFGQWVKENPWVTQDPVQSTSENVSSLYHQGRTMYQRSCKMLNVPAKLLATAKTSKRLESNIQQSGKLLKQRRTNKQPEATTSSYAGPKQCGSKILTTRIRIIDSRIPVKQKAQVQNAPKVDTRSKSKAKLSQPNGSRLLDNDNANSLAQTKKGKKMKLKILGKLLLAKFEELPDQLPETLTPPSVLFQRIREELANRKQNRA